MDRKSALLGMGTLALAACSGVAPLPRTAVNNKVSSHVPRRTMSLPAGYTTTTSSAGTIYTTTLLYNGVAVATLSLDTSSWKTTFTDLTTSRGWTSTSPAGTAAMGAWYPTANTTVTFQSSSYMNASTPNGNGYFYSAVSSDTGDYYTGMYHPAYWSSEQDMDSGIYAGLGGGGSRCGTHVCPNGAFECGKAIGLAGIGAICMVASVAGSLTGALTPLAIAGLVGGHIALLWGISDVFQYCL